VDFKHGKGDKGIVQNNPTATFQKLQPKATPPLPLRVEQGQAESYCANGVLWLATCTYNNPTAKRRKETSYRQFQQGATTKLLTKWMWRSLFRIRPERYVATPGSVLHLDLHRDTRKSDDPGLGERGVRRSICRAILICAASWPGCVRMVVGLS
jgi:hypothetical protein